MVDDDDDDEQIQVLIQICPFPKSPSPYLPLMSFVCLFFLPIWVISMFLVKIWAHPSSRHVDLLRCCTPAPATYTCANIRLLLLPLATRSLNFTTACFEEF